MRRIFMLYADGVSSVKIAKLFNAEGVKTPARMRMEKGMKAVKPKNGVFRWQHSGILQILKNRAYTGDLVQGKRECRELRKEVVVS